MPVPVPLCLRNLLAAPLFALGLLAAGSASAAPLPVQMHYAVDMNPGTAEGRDIQGLFVFEWDALGSLHVDGDFTMAGRGITVLERTLDFQPVAALLIGYGRGIPNVGDGKDHLYTLVDDAFAGSATGLRWSAAFPGTATQPRIGHDAMVGVLASAADGDAASLSQLTAWVQAEGHRAAFNPAGRYTMLEWTIAGPIGGNVPEPASLALVALGLAAAVSARRRRAA